MLSGVDSRWSQEDFERGLEVRIGSRTKESLSFDLVGTDPSIANGLRRIMLAEVPTVAIEQVFYINNTSIITVSHVFLV